MSESPAQKKSMILDMLKNGLLSDENGKITQRMKSRITDLLGFSSFENGQDIINLNIKRAAKENLMLAGEVFPPQEIDDHNIHITEHIKYMLSGEFESLKSKCKTENFLSHIRGHKAFAETYSSTEEVS